MLDKCGVSDLRGLYSDVPEELMLTAPYALPQEMSEKEVRDRFGALPPKTARLTYALPVVGSTTTMCRRRLCR